MNLPSGDVSWMETLPFAERVYDVREDVSPFTTRIVSVKNGKNYRPFKPFLKNYELTEELHGI